MRVLNDKAKADILADIEDATESMGLGDRWGFVNKDAQYTASEDYGLCNSCKNRVVIKGRYGIKLFRCGTEDLRLSTDDPVAECTSYERIGSLSITAMVSMAHLIDVEKDKKVGF